MDASPSSSQGRRVFNDWQLAALLLLPLVVMAGNDIQDVDPAQYADVTRHMFDSHDWAHLRDNFGPFLNKPPLTFWMMCGAFVALGKTALAVRLPSLLMGLVVLLCTARVGTLVYDQRTGRWAAALLGVSLGFELMALDPKVDMVVTATISLTLLLLLEARRRPGWAWLAWVTAGLGMLAKGPIGLGVPALAVLPEALRRPWDAPLLERASLWRKLRPFQPLGVLLVPAVLAPWYLKLLGEYGSSGPAFLLWHQSFGRLFERTYRNSAGTFFFLHTALWAFLPFIPMLIAELWRRARGWQAAGWKLPPSPERVVLWWLALPLLFISLSSYKLPQYLFWLAPPAALLSARYLSELGPANMRALAWLGRVALFLAALVLVAVVGVERFVFPARGVELCAWTAGVALLLGVGTWRWRRLGGGEGLLAFAVLTFLAFDLFFAGYLHPQLMAFQPGNALGHRVRAEDPQGTILPFFGIYPPNSVAFFADRDSPLLALPDLVAQVRAGHTHLAVIAPSQRGVLEAQSLAVTEVASYPAFHVSKPSGRFLLARTRPSTLETWELVSLKLR